MAGLCVKALLLLTVVSSAYGCSNVVQWTVRNITTLLLNTPSVWPMKLYMANEAQEGRDYACYVMDSSFKVTYTDNSGNLTYSLSPTSNTTATGGTYQLKYTVPKKWMFGATQDNTEVTLQVMALYTDFVFWEVCENSRTWHFMFVKNGVDMANLDYRCMRTAIQYTFGVNSFPKGICASS